MGLNPGCCCSEPEDVGFLAMCAFGGATVYYTQMKNYLNWMHEDFGSTQNRYMTDWLPASQGLPFALSNTATWTFQGTLGRHWPYAGELDQDGDNQQLYRPLLNRQPFSDSINPKPALINTVLNYACNEQKNGVLTATHHHFPDAVRSSVEKEGNNYPTRYHRGWCDTFKIGMKTSSHHAYMCCQPTTDTSEPEAKRTAWPILDINLTSHDTSTNKLSFQIDFAYDRLVWDKMDLKLWWYPFDWTGGPPNFSPTFDSWSGPGQVDAGGFPHITVKNIKSAGPGTLVIKLNDPPNQVPMPQTNAILSAYTGETPDWWYDFNNCQYVDVDPNFRYVSAYVQSFYSSSVLGTDQIEIPTGNYGTMVDDDLVFDFELNINGCTIPGMLMTPRNADMIVDGGHSPLGSPMHRVFDGYGTNLLPAYHCFGTSLNHGGTMVGKYWCGCSREEFTKDAVPNYTGPNESDDWHAGITENAGNQTYNKGGSFEGSEVYTKRPISHADVAGLGWELAGGQLKRKTTTEDATVMGELRVIVAMDDCGVNPAITPHPTQTWNADNIDGGLGKDLCAIDRRFMANLKKTHSRYKDKSIQISGKITQQLKNWTGDDVERYGYYISEGQYKTKHPSCCSTEWSTTGGVKAQQWKPCFEWIDPMWKLNEGYVSGNRVVVGQSFSTDYEDPDQNTNVFIEANFGWFNMWGHSDELRVFRPANQYNNKIPEISTTVDLGSIGSGSAVAYEWEMTGLNPEEWCWPNTGPLTVDPPTLNSPLSYYWLGTMKIAGTTVIDSEVIGFHFEANQRTHKGGVGQGYSWLWPEWAWRCNGITAEHYARGALGREQDPGEPDGVKRRATHIARDIAYFSGSEISMEITPVAGGGEGPGIP